MRGRSRACRGGGTAEDDATPRKRVIVAHPSPDLYGSDLQMVSAVDGLLERGWHVTVFIPEQGPLSRLLAERPAITVRICSFPVLRRALLRPHRLAAMIVNTIVAAVRLTRLIRSDHPDVVYVNTITIPVWLLAARLAGVRAVVHVREAEESWPKLVRRLLSAPLQLASVVLTNSEASRQVLLGTATRLAERTVVIYNGIVGPPDVGQRPATGPARLVLVARLSPRKGIDVALAALALLRSDGRDVVLDICGTTFHGYEWYEEQLRARADQPDLRGAVTFRGYVNPTFAVLREAAVVLVPSLAEPFGNTAVEAQLAERPVVASAVQGLIEIVTDGETGLLVTPGDATALAKAIARLLDDPDLAEQLASTARRRAQVRFSIDRYHEEVSSALCAPTR